MLFGKKRSPVEKEWNALLKKEAALGRAAGKANARWREELEQKVPAKVLSGLRISFSKGFQLVFRHSTGILEKTYDSEALLSRHNAADLDVMTHSSRKNLQKIRLNSQGAQLANMAITTVEGVGLGALGIGMPDIVLFLAMLLKGIYETALNYGYDYDSPGERLLILKMMEASLSKGGDWYRCNREVEEMLRTPAAPDEDILKEQIRRTGEAFAMDMLLVKFIQGMPIVGILGGAANPLYYNKVMQYVQLKYRKRYLLSVARRKGMEALLRAQAEA